MPKLPFSGSFADLLKPIPIRWPTPGDRLFKLVPAIEDSAEIHKDGNRSAHMTEGYRTAADILVDRTIEEPFSRHELVYPILFCYRQFIELSLKRQIAIYGEDVGIKTPRHGHDLNELLESYIKMTELYGANSDCDALIAFSECIREFDWVDPKSFSFRYATDKDGILYNIPVDTVDLGRIRDVISGVAAYFSGSDSLFWEIMTAGPDP
jgi:hypothetical protein